MELVMRKERKVKAEKSSPKNTPPEKKKSDHHRRPTSISGSQEKRNRVDIPQDIHRAWHETFGNMCAEKIAKYMTELLKADGFEIWCFRNLEPLHPFRCPPKASCALSCTFTIPTKGHKEAWEKLQKLILETSRGHATPMHAVIGYINRNLIDNDYRLHFAKVTRRGRP